MDELSRLRERVAELEGALRGYLNAHRTRRRATETFPCECYLCDDARTALAPHPVLPPSEKERG